MTMSAATSALAACETPAIDRSALYRLKQFGGDRLMLNMIDVFLVDVPSRLAVARDAAQNGDAVGVRRSLHSLKSSAGQLGAHIMMRKCESGESLAATNATYGLIDAVAAVCAAFAEVSDALVQLAATARGAA